MKLTIVERTIQYKTRGPEKIPLIHTLDLWIPPQFSSAHRQLCERKHLQKGKTTRQEVHCGQDLQERDCTVGKVSKHYNTKVLSKMSMFATHSSRIKKEYDHHHRSNCDALVSITNGNVMPASLQNIFFFFSSVSQITM